ncbi:MAG: serine/threonine-protein kinase [Minicystis sp.]
MEGSQQAASSTGAASSLGKYRLIAELGHGGMAEVFLAVVRGPAGFNKLVVIKQIRPQLAEDPEFLGMFLDEARLAARLSHPNVVQTNEVGQEGERYFIAMEYLEGQPLNRVLHRLGRSGGLPLGMNLRVVSEVLSGLHHAHELTDYDGTPLGVVHRDITPHNIFVTYDGQVKVVDFGIAKALNSSSETRTGVLKGKVAYMAPEQARGERVDRRADIFSVGVLLWEASTGKRLWKGVPDITILQRLLSGEIPSPKSVKADVSDRLEEIIMKALAHQRDNRYETAIDLQTDIEAYLDTLDDRVSTRELGKLITKHFETDRAKIKGIIDEQLRAKTGAAISDPKSLPIIDQHTASVLGSSANVISSPDTVGSSEPSRVSKVEAAPTSSLSAQDTGPSMLFASSATADGTGGAPSKRGMMAGIAVAAGAVIAVGLWFATRTPPVTTNTTGSTGQTTSAPVVNTAAVAPEIELSVVATPPEAKITLDGKPLAGNPFKGKVASDKGKHQLTIEAPGYGPLIKMIDLDSNLELQLALVKQATVPDVATTTSKPDDRQPIRRPVGGPLVPAEEPARPPTKKPQRPIDPNNPYGDNQ